MNSCFGLPWRGALSGALLALLAATPAWSHDEATLDAMEAPHGGQLRMSGNHHYELVVAKSGEAGEHPVQVFVSNHAGDAQDVSGARAQAVMQSGKLRTWVTLQPDGPSAFKGWAKYPPAADLIVLLNVTFPDGSIEQARFTPLARRAPAQ
ncbi:MAG: hypothetical protein KF778_16875 [Rhodocyclaceae bacterium]|nr:hypothetical protein [Rhodocyclaceae bacterium]MBX3670077.1 hypothetical protein [Rhodocyclaceae bacterium]